MNVAARLPVLRVEEVESADDIFRCNVLRCSLSARSCVARQRAAAAPPVKWRPGLPHRDYDFSSCRACPDGVLVAFAVGPIAPPAPISQVRLKRDA